MRSNGVMIRVIDEFQSAPAPRDGRCTGNNMWTVAGYGVSIRSRPEGREMPVGHTVVGWN